jgi:Leucine-rich repeat (LRR) protein
VPPNNNTTFSVKKCSFAAITEPRPDRLEWHMRGYHHHFDGSLFGGGERTRRQGGGQRKDDDGPIVSLNLDWRLILDHHHVYSDDMLDYWLEIPPNVFDLQYLEKLSIESYYHDVIPNELFGGRGGHIRQTLTNLRILRCEALTTLPAELGQLGHLHFLQIHACDNLERLPPEIGLLANLRHFAIAKCPNIRHLPPQIGQLHRLEWLDVNRLDHLTCLPADIFAGMKALQILDIHSCEELSGIPESIGQLSSLRSFQILKCGSLEALPNEIGRLERLERLSIDDCPISCIPAEVGNLRSLVSLSIHNCQRLTNLPSSLGTFCRAYLTSKGYHPSCVICHNS